MFPVALMDSEEVFYRGGVRYRRNKETAAGYTNLWRGCPPTVVNER